MWRLKPAITCALIVVLFAPRTTTAHGYMLQPPSRQSAWRLGYSVPINYNDNQLWCGGRTIQWDVNAGKCGICGDSWSANPRNYELPNGSYVKNVSPVNKEFSQGQTINISIMLTANHNGFFEFRVCNRDALLTPDATQECLDENLLHFDDSTTRFQVPPSKTGQYDFKVQLPPSLTCDHCLLQWKYHAGNDWGCWDNGQCCTGCGIRQEEFYACADVVIRPAVDGITPPLTSTILSNEESPSESNVTPTYNSLTSTSAPEVFTKVFKTAVTKSMEKKLRQLCFNESTRCFKFCNNCLPKYFCSGVCTPCYEYFSQSRNDN